MRAAKLSAGGLIRVGQRVYCGLYGGKYGVVSAVHGEQSPESVRSLMGVVATGGRAEFDVAFDDHVSRRLPECILRGVQWEIYDEVATAEEIAAVTLRAHAAVAKAKAEEEAAGLRRAAERLAHAEANPHLLKRNLRTTWSEARVAAENIRRELRAAFPGFKFSVKTDGHDSVNVDWTDGPTTREVGRITGKYKAGDFDGMNDTYEYDRDATFADVFGSPRYVSKNRKVTDEGARWAWTHAKDAANLPGHCGWGDAEDVGPGWYNGPRGDEIRRTWSEVSVPVGVSGLVAV